MQARGSQKVWVLTAGALIAAHLPHSTRAAPPGSLPLSSLQKITVTQNLTENLSRLLPTRLDLRAPSNAIEEKSGIFPSAIIHRQFGGSEQSAQLPNLGAANPRIRPPLAELARHIQHEGLPIARLWENNTALVHIGLNQKGKPGLWLVQKIH